MRTLVPIDSQYMRPELAACYLIIDGDRATFVEANTRHAVPQLLAALRSHGLSPEQVDHIIVTHAHLDHAGGCGTLAAACPNATVVAHPRAASHLIDPTRLIEGARQVYGEHEMARLYGEIEPVPAARVRTVADGEELSWQGAPLRFLHTLGHANHHMCISDPSLDGVFTGDAFGIAYPALQHRGLFIFPTTSPTGFQPREAREAVARIARLGVRHAFLTHYGAVSDLPAAAQQLDADLAFSEELTQQAAASQLPAEQLAPFCLEHLTAHFAGRLAALGLALDETTRDLLALDLELNAGGVAHTAARLRKGA